MNKITFEENNPILMYKVKIDLEIKNQNINEVVYTNIVETRENVKFKGVDLSNQVSSN